MFQSPRSLIKNFSGDFSLFKSLGCSKKFKLSEQSTKMRFHWIIMTKGFCTRFVNDSFVEKLDNDSPEKAKRRKDINFNSLHHQPH